MKIIFKLFTLFFLTYSIGTAQNGKNFIDQPYMEVTGKSKMEIIPDEIYVRIELNENDKKGRMSIEKQENKMINNLKKLNIDLNEDLSVISFSGYYKRKFLAENGITKRKSYQLIIHSGKMLGEVFQSLDEIDISSFYIMRTSHSNIEELKEKNKVDALTKAKKKATAFALALNQELKGAIFVQEYANNNMYLNRKDYNVALESSNMASGANISDLNIKPIILESTILAKFAIN